MIKPCNYTIADSTYELLDQEKAMAVVKGLRETVESRLAEIKADPATGMHGSVEVALCTCIA